MSEHAKHEVQRVIEAGPAEGEDFFRLRLSGENRGHHVNVTPGEAARIAHALGDGFSLAVTMGNAAMRTREDIAAVLESCAEAVRTGGDSGRLRDANGNGVGSWRYEPGTCDGCGRPMDDIDAPGEPCGVCGAGYDH